MREEYSLLGADLTGLWLQPGFVEGIIVDRKRFATLADAFRHVFRRNLEYAVLLWNGLPVRLSYEDDLPAMISTLITMLENALRTDPTSGSSYEFVTPDMESSWQVHADSEMITIEGSWQKLPGRYEAALNRLGIVRMRRTAFLCEWKLLLQQLIKAISDSEAVLTTIEARNQLQKLRRIESEIPSRGRFYQY